MGEPLEILVVDDLPEKRLPFEALLSPLGQRLPLVDSGTEALRRVLAQKFDILNSVCEGDIVALEVFWHGYLAVPVDTLPADSEMRAHFSVWLEFRDGKICRQHNYDCFDPWWV